MVDELNGQWGVVELMGHKTVAGLLSKTEMLGKALLRVDVPKTETFPAFTQLYGDAAIYCVTFVAEEVARNVANSISLNPISVYTPDLITVERHEQEVNNLRDTIKRMRALPEPEEYDEDDEEAWQTVREYPGS